MKLKSLNTLRASIVLLAGCAAQAHASSATFDPATGIVDIPVVDVRNGTDVSTFAAQLQLTANGQLQVISGSAIASSLGERVTYFSDTNSVHLPTVEVVGSSDVFYAKLSVVPGVEPLTFNLERLVSNEFEGCPDFATDGPIPGSCVLSGEINQDVFLTKNTDWILSGYVAVGGDKTNTATLSIDPGTHIFGQQGNDALLIRRGSKIMAEGTPDQPIVFTGPNEQSAGEWGGVVISGNAPVNGCSEGVAICETSFEAITSEFYGGNDSADSSGLLKYVQINYAGFEVRPDEELNGLTLLGVGSGTVVDYVQVHEGLDDGVEMFGGTVQMKHLVLTNIGDDSLDWGSGWKGKAQYVVIKQAADDGDRGIEADNNGDNNDALPRSQPLLANITAVGFSPDNSQGVLLRRGTGVNIYNSVFTGFAGGCIRLDGDATYINGGTLDNLSGELTIENSYVDCLVNFADKADSNTYTTEEWFNIQANNVAGDPLLSGVYPATGSPLLSSGTVAADSFLDSVSYVGAFKDASDNWADEWTSGL